jgi:hypothetical protein
MVMAAKDNLKDLLQERFSGHELDVDPGVWQAISGQLATMPPTDGLSKLLKDRFKDHELNVDPGVWSNISGQLGHGAAAGTAAGPGMGGWLAAGLAATVITGGALLWTLRNGQDLQTPTAAAVVEAPAPAPAEVPAPDATVMAPATGSAVAAPPIPATSPSDERPTAGAVNTTGAPQASNNADMPGPGITPQTSAPATNDDRPTATDSDQERVNRIIEQLIERTASSPVVAQTESLPDAGLVAGQEPQLPEAEETDVVVAAAAAPVVWIPNAFSPGMRDGVNDDLRVVAEGLTDLRVRIYSLDSRLVFSANDLHSWDGRDLSGQPCPQGYYFYAIEGLDANGQPFSKGQTIHLFR